MSACSSRRGEDFLQNGMQNLKKNFVHNSNRQKVQHCTREKAAFFKSVAYSKG